MRKRRCSTALAAASESTAAPVLLVREDASSQFEAEEEGSASYISSKKDMSSFEFIFTCGYASRYSNCEFPLNLLLLKRSKQLIEGQ